MRLDVFQFLLGLTLICGCQLTADETVEFTSRVKSQPSVFLPQPKDKDTIRVVSYDDQVIVEIVIAAGGDETPLRLMPESQIELSGGSLPWLYKHVRIPSRIDLSGKLVLRVGSRKSKEALRKLITDSQTVRAEFILRSPQSNEPARKLGLAAAMIPIPVLRDWLKKDWMRSPY